MEGSPTQTFDTSVQCRLLPISSGQASLRFPKNAQGAAMDRRRQQRVFVDLPVRIWGLDVHSRPFTQSASVRTISGRGATLQAVDAQLKPGDTVDVQYEGTKAKFRIVWSGKTVTPMH